MKKWMILCEPRALSRESHAFLQNSVNQSIFDLLEVGDIDDSDEEITSLLEDYVSDPYHFIRVS